MKKYITILTILCFQNFNGNAQLLKKLKDKANEKIENTKNKAVQKAKDRVNNKEAKADSKVDNTVDNGLDKVEGLFKKKDKIAKDSAKLEGNEGAIENVETKENTDTKTETEKQDADEQNTAPQQEIKLKKEVEPSSILFTTEYLETADKNKAALPGVLQFVKDKEYIQRVSLPIIENLAKQVNSSEYILQVVVYTSDTNSIAQKLSIKRAASIIKYLQYFYKTPNDKIFNTRMVNNGNKEYNKADKQNDSIEILMIKKQD
jgi:outer membrane protein OmpA-like peptidoglycan-associated protein